MKIGSNTYMVGLPGYFSVFFFNLVISFVLIDTKGRG